MLVCITGWVRVVKKYNYKKNYRYRVERPGKSRSLNRNQKSVFYLLALQTDRHTDNTQTLKASIPYRVEALKYYIHFSLVYYNILHSNWVINFIRQFNFIRGKVGKYRVTNGYINENALYTYVTASLIFSTSTLRHFSKQYMSIPIPAV